MRKVISLILAVWLICAVFPMNIAVYADNDDTKFSVPIWGNRYSSDSIKVVYKNKMAFIRLADACELTGAAIVPSESTNGITIVKRGLVKISIDVTRNIVSIYLGDDTGSSIIPLPFVNDADGIWVSLDYFSQYMGAEINVDEKDNRPIRVKSPETLDQILSEFADFSNEYVFSWMQESTLSEADAKKAMEISYIDTVIFEYNFSIFSIEDFNQTIYEDILTKILLNEGTDHITSEKDLGLALVKSDIEYAGMVNDWIGLFNDVEKIDDIGLLDQVSYLFDGYAVTSNAIDAWNAVNQYCTIAKTQKELLRETLLANKPDSWLSTPLWYRAADNVQKKIDKSYDEYKLKSDEAIISGLKTALQIVVKAGFEVNPAVKCLNVAWDSAKIIAKAVPGAQGHIDAAVNLTYAQRSNNIQGIAISLICDSYRDADASHLLNDAKNESVKQSLILVLKAALTGRECLRDSFVYGDYPAELQEKIKKTAILLNKAENCSVHVTASKNEIKENNWAWVNNEKYKPLSAYQEYQKANAAMNDLKSYEIKASVNMAVTVDGKKLGDLKVDGSTKIAKRTATDVDFSITIDESMLGENIAIKIYYRSDGYVYTDMQGQKIKTTIDPAAALAQSEGLTGFVFAESSIKNSSAIAWGDDKKITFELTGTELQQLIVDTLFKSFSDSFEDQIGQISLKNASYTAIIDKNSVIKSVELDYVIEITDQNEKAVCDVVSKANVEGINNTTVTFPADIDGYGYYHVDQAENLQFAFDDIAESISNGAKIVINIACPVDAAVTYQGEQLNSAANQYADSASFGTLKLLGKNQDIKVFSLDADKDYEVALTGTDVGTMDYSVNYLDDQENLTDYRSFSAVPITAATKIQTATEHSGTVALNVDEDGDGVYDSVWEAGLKQNGSLVSDNKPTPYPEPIVPDTPENSADPVSDSLVVVIMVGGIIILGGLIALVAVISSNSRKRRGRGGVPPTPETKNGSIVILSGSMAGMSFAVNDGETLSIGRGSGRGAQVVLTDDDEYELVSRLHCTISYNQFADRYFVTDCSNNGTFTADHVKLEPAVSVVFASGSRIVLADDNCQILLK